MAKIKLVQISAGPNFLYALDDKGKLWMRSNGVWNLIDSPLEDSPKI